ncbi:MAG TPA: hypothetical protein VES39_05765, partial [Rhodospirillales bacterium]|nr:hypothetical protein [Rhodospirillales bacterium]
ALVGCWPAEFHAAGELDPDAVAQLRERMSAYMIKAVREAKTHSSWINPNGEYENALLSLIGRCLDASRPNPFLADFRDFHRPVAVAGALNGLAQTTLKLTAPGVPDLYQGCEMWDFALVDPDNRRPVDFDERMHRLTRLAEAFAQQGEELAPGLLHDWPDGTIKLFVIWRLLGLRRARPELFRRAPYIPVEAEGRGADHVCAFIRGEGGTKVLTVAPRLAARLLAITGDWPVGEAAWSDCSLTLPPMAGDEPWEDVFTGRRITADVAAASGGADDRRRLPLGHAFATFPIAVLLQQPADAGGW